jgi:hypothetical protein
MIVMNPRQSEEARLVRARALPRTADSATRIVNPSLDDDGFRSKILKSTVECV